MTRPGCLWISSFSRPACGPRYLANRESPPRFARPPRATFFTAEDAEARGGNSCGISKRLDCPLNVTWPSRPCVWPGPPDVPVTSDVNLMYCPSAFLCVLRGKSLRRPPHRPPLRSAQNPAASSWKHFIRSPALETANHRRAVCPRVARLGTYIFSLLPDICCV